MTRTILAIALLLPLLATAEMYRWKDENGNWQFGDRAPVTDHEAMELKGPAKLGQDENVQQINQRLQRLRESEKIQQKLEKDQARRQEAANRRRMEPLCNQARERIKMLNGPFVYIDEDGTQRDSLREEAEADITRTQKWIDENCENY